MVRPYLETLAQVREKLQEWPEFGALCAEAEDLSARLASGKQLVAVFGAFSAGKSSLINAILGAPVLAVSPNPTTATITQVYFSPANKAVQPDAISVVAKTEAQFWEDVRQACASVRLPVQNLEDAMRQAAGLNTAYDEPHARKAAQFLKAAAAGYPQMKDHLGTQWTVPASQLRQLTAQEQVACYIQRVDLVHASALLPESFVLVDTPGVDSIHQRHTDVAFSYMRKADALVFVLYYTHAFSRADKEFLQQLANVQDVSGIDKLYVVINAVDLAVSEEERLAVRQRVAQELRQLGIRQPRIYEVSSQLALAAAQLAQTPDDPRFIQLVRQRLRLGPDDPLPDLATLYQRSGLYHLCRDLQSQVVVQQERLAEDALGRWLQTASHQVSVLCAQEERLQASRAQGQAQLAQARAELSEEVAQALARVRSGHSPLAEALRADWDELLFHAGERIRLKLSSLAREAFHPGRFREGKSLRQEGVAALTELADMLGRQIEIEARTFAVRAEANALEAVRRLDVHWGQRLAEEGLVLHTPAELPEHGFLTERGFRAELQPAQWSGVLRHLSSVKQFVEGNGFEQMLQDLTPLVLSAVSGELQRLAGPVADTGVSWAAQQECAVLQRCQSELSVGHSGEPDADRLPRLSALSEFVRSMLDGLRSDGPPEVGAAAVSKDTSGSV